MSKDYLYKKDALFVLWEKYEEDEYFPIDIPHVNSGGNFYGKWLEFQPELDKFEIREDADEWYCNREISREDLKKELEDKGFKVVLGENY